MQERIESEQLTLYMVRSTYRGEIVRRHRSTYSQFPSILLLKYFEVFFVFILTSGVRAQQKCLANMEDSAANARSVVGLVCVNMENGTADARSVVGHN